MYYFQRVHKEALIWRQLNHPYILPFLGIDIVTFPDYPTLVSPWMENGTLLNFVCQQIIEGIAKVYLVCFTSFFAVAWFDEHMTIALAGM